MSEFTDRMGAMVAPAKNERAKLVELLTAIEAESRQYHRTGDQIGDDIHADLPALVGMVLGERVLTPEEAARRDQLSAQPTRTPEEAVELSDLMGEVKAAPATDAAVVIDGKPVEASHVPA